MTTTSHDRDKQALQEARHILSLRLLIAQAGNKDSLGWWDDDSLAGHSAFLLTRIFPIEPLTAARSLALQAALARHQAAFEDNARAFHLFRLDRDNQDGLLVRFLSPGRLPMPDDPITSIDELRDQLLRLTVEPRPYTRVREAAGNRLLIELPPPIGMPYLRHRAETLAWAYLEAEPGRPVFPYFTEQSFD